MRWRRSWGSIPACAGEPYLAGNAGHRFMVYPRVCGGTTGDSTQPLVAPGLSPRVRGNRAAAGSSAAFSGSIPACAGEPGGWRQNPSGGGVYPRVCGGTGGAPEAAVAVAGLSPRVRGNRYDIS